VANAQNINMPYEAAVGSITEGYRGQIPANAALVSGQKYTERITATQGGNTRPFNVACIAVDG
jgi:hypothetical protein